jgi:hypothetical protein
MMAVPVICNPLPGLEVFESGVIAGIDPVLVTLSAFDRGAEIKVVLSSSPKTFTIPSLHVRTRLPPETVVYASCSSSPG